MQKPRLNISLPPEILEDLKHMAKSLGQPTSKVAEQILCEYIPVIMDQNQVFDQAKHENLTDAQLALRMLTSALNTFEKELGNK